MAPLLLRAPALFSSQQSASVIGLDFFFHVHHFIFFFFVSLRACVYPKPFRLEKLGVILERDPFAVDLFSRNETYTLSTL
jgi:hypothetical protein